MASKGISHRDWSIDRADYETDDDFRQAVVTELAAIEHMGERLGITVIPSPVRERVGGSWHTLAWVFQTASVPAASVPASGAPTQTELAELAARDTFGPLAVDGPPEAEAA